ncbi:MAG: peptidylprolyl isomerase [Rhodocyclaceae bacterium]|nr:peptidylprolyl isomerase [Rhodocyclaceae bacterium]
MKRHPFLAACLAALFATAATVPTLARADDDVVAKVNGTAIRQSQIETAARNLIAQGQQDTPDLRTRLKDELIARELILQQAAAEGLDRRDEVREQIQLARSNILINSYLQVWAREHPISEDDLKAEYDKFRANQPPADEFLARHILIKDEKAAKAVLAKLKKGEKFDKLATALSEDTGTKAKGGELGWVRSDANLVQPFMEAMKKLKKGETSEPVKTDFGFHVIRVDDVRKAEPPSFEQVRAELNQFMQRRGIEQMVRDLRAKATVE